MDLPLENSRPFPHCHMRKAIEFHFRLDTDLEFLSAVRYLGLYAGFFPALFGHMPGNAVYLVTYTFLKDRFQKYDDKKHPGRISDGTQAPWVSAAAAAGADLAAISLYVPVDVVAQRLYLQTPTGAPRYSGYQEVIKTILTNEGWKGFYKGVGPILVNSLPASALWWTLYEESKRFLSKKFSDYRSVEAANKLAANKVSQADGSSSATSESSPFEPTTKVVEKSSLASFISGGIAGAAVTFFTNPLDVVSTRLQTQSMKAEAYQYTGTLHTIKEMWRTEGFRSFFKGTTPRLTQWVIFSAIGGFSYEFIVDLSTIKK